METVFLYWIVYFIMYKCSRYPHISTGTVDLTIQTSFKQTCIETFNFSCLKHLTFNQPQMAQVSPNCKKHFHLKHIPLPERC